MSKIDRELAEIEARRAEPEAVAHPAAKKRGVRAFLKRVARDAAMRRVSTKR